MKKRITLTALALLLVVATALAQGELAAALVGTVVKGSYTAQEELSQASVVVWSETETTRYALPGFIQLSPLAAGETAEFSVDLSSVNGPVTITDIQTGQTESADTLSGEQRAAILTGRLSAGIYRGTEPTPDALLAECEVTSPAAAMTVSSAGIVNGVIADEYGKKGTQKRKGIPTLSLPLSVRNLPEGTAVLAVAMVDPDGGDWVHWLAANLPVAEEIPQNRSIDLAGQMVQGKNDFGFTGYGGPTPPSGTHTYVLTVYALSEPLVLKDGFTWKAFQKALDGKILAQADVTGDYSK